MDRLVQDGIELNRAYQYKFCSPTRCSLQVLCNARHRARNAREAAHRVSWIVVQAQGRCTGAAMARGGSWRA
jgi:hypothetical protein